LQEDTIDSDNVANIIYQYLRINSSFKDFKKSDNFGESLIKAYNKHYGSLKTDLQKSINQFHQYLDENVDPIKGEYVQSGPWCAIGLEGEVKKSVQISQDNSSRSIRRHNLYFSFHHNKLDFASKKIRVSGIVEYFDDLKNVMIEIFKEASKFNSNNSNCKINEFKTLMYTKATSIIGPKANNGDLLMKFFTEADNLKIYIGSVDRNTSSLDSIKKEIIQIVESACTSNNFTMSTRKRTQTGYDFTTMQGKKSSFGDTVAFILSKQIAGNDKLKENIINLGQVKLDYYVNQVEDFVAKPENSHKVVEMLKDKKL